MRRILSVLTSAAVLLSLPLAAQASANSRLIDVLEGLPFTTFLVPTLIILLAGALLAIMMLRRLRR